MFNYYEGQSVMHRMNPVLKLAATGISMILLTFSFDPFVPLALLIIILFLSHTLGKVTLFAMLKGLSPFIILAFGFFVMQVIFPRDAGEDILFRIIQIEISATSVLRGAALGLRVLAYAAYALLFVATTDPTELLLSLMQQTRLSPKYGYSILAAYRFFPLYQSEFTSLKEAHQVRGYSEKRNIRGRYNKLKRYAIPLLAQAIRKAERVAVAMEARGFTGKSNRTYYKKISIRPVDWVLAIALTLIVPFLIIIVHSLGLLIFWDGSLFF